MPPPVDTVARTLFSSALKAIKKNNLIEAETVLAQCIAADETWVDAWLQLGLIWTKMNRFSEAIDAFRMVLALDEKNIDAMHNLGLALTKTGQEEEGLDFLNKACLVSNDPEMAISLGDIYYKLRDYKNSSFFLLKAYQKDRMNVELIKKLAISLFQDGDASRAVHLMIGLVLRFPKDSVYKALLSELMNKWALDNFDADTKKAIVLCLGETFLRHRNVAPAWCGIFLTDPSYEPIRKFPATAPENIDSKKLFSLLKEPFICLGLQRIITANAPIEHILTALRRYFLLNWEQYASWPRSVLEFLTSLAIQCWYNDFIFYQTPDEKIQIQKLADHFSGNLENSSKKIDADTAKLLALISCYQPLYETYTAETPPTFSGDTTAIISPLVQAQYDNPRYETSLIPQIKSFTEIEDITSKAVQSMYENRPYPRWTSVNSSKTSDALTRISNNLEILVAGCGTGQEPCLYASVLPGARITALDLSRASIAYGMRMAEKLGFLPRINFLHGDIMKAPELNKKFDYVVSSGVLHHLKDPEKGLAAILQTLKPGGKMSLSLYSKHARDLILNPASAYIQEKGYTSSVDDIRQFRQDVMKMTPDDPRTFCTKAADFFNLSECNDLLFHVQEHRYTFPLIQEMADRHGLEPFLVGLSPDMRKTFEEMFPGGKRSDLALMNQFEEKYPSAFAEMYKVYFNRKGENTPHPLDSLILLGSI